MCLNKYKWLVSTIIAAILMFPLLSLAANMTLSQQNFYAGEKCRLKVTFPAKAVSQSGVAWTINCLGAELCAGNATVSPDGSFEIEFNAPSLKPEISVKAELVCKNVPGSPSAALFFRSAEIFVPVAAIEALKLNVLKTGEGEEPLTAAFKAQKIPFKQISGIEEFDGQALIVCGMDFDENADTAKALLALAAQGKKVIILPPLKGHFPAGRGHFDQIMLGKAEYIKSFDKEFDLPAVSGTFTASAWDELFALTCSAQADGLSCGVFKSGRGSIIITTWDLAKMRETNPSAWYLLKAWLLK